MVNKYITDLKESLHVYDEYFETAVPTLKLQYFIIKELEKIPEEGLTKRDRLTYGYVMREFILSFTDFTVKRYEIKSRQVHDKSAWFDTFFKKGSGYGIDAESGERVFHKALQDNFKKHWLRAAEDVPKGDTQLHEHMVHIRDKYIGHRDLKYLDGTFYEVSEQEIDLCLQEVESFQEWFDLFMRAEGVDKAHDDLKEIAKDWVWGK